MVEIAPLLTESEIERLRSYLRTALKKNGVRNKYIEKWLCGLTIGIIPGQAFVKGRTLDSTGQFDHERFSIVHTGESTKTIWFGELFLRELLKEGNLSGSDQIFNHEVKHIIYPNDAGAEHDTVKFKKMMEIARKRCVMIEKTYSSSPPAITSDTNMAFLSVDDYGPTSDHMTAENEIKEMLGQKGAHIPDSRHLTPTRNIFKGGSEIIRHYLDDVGSKKGLTLFLTGGNYDECILEMFKFVITSSQFNMKNRSPLHIVLCEDALHNFGIQSAVRSDFIRYLDLLPFNTAAYVDGELVNLSVPDPDVGFSVILSVYSGNDQFRSMLNERTETPHLKMENGAHSTAKRLLGNMPVPRSRSISIVRKIYSSTRKAGLYQSDAILAFLALLDQKEVNARISHPVIRKRISRMLTVIQAVDRLIEKGRPGLDVAATISKISSRIEQSAAEQKVSDIDSLIILMEQPAGKIIDMTSHPLWSEPPVKINSTGTAGSPAQLLESLKSKENASLLDLARSPAGISVKKVLLAREPFSLRTVQREFESLKELGIFVPAPDRRGFYKFSEMFIGEDEDHTRTMINAVNGIRYGTNSNGNAHPLHRGDIPSNSRSTLKELIKMTVLHQKNIMRYAPSVGKDKVLWHLIEHDVVSDSQKSSFIQRINNASKRSRSAERLWILRNDETIYEAVERIRSFCPNALFDVALSSSDHMENVPVLKGDNRIKMLVFEGSSNDIRQIEGIILALGTLHLPEDRAVAELKDLFHILTGTPYINGKFDDIKLREMLVQAPRDFARNFIFTLPPAEEYVDDIDELNKRLLTFLTAA